MSDPKDQKPADSPAAGQDISKSETSKKSGRVTRDARGNAVWEWETETGVFSKEVSTQRLKKLEAKDLAFLETGAIKKPPENKSPSGFAPKGPSAPTASKPPMPAKGSGFNPYDSSSPAGGGYSHAPKPTLVEEPKAKRRSIQSIVADQKSRDKKA